MLPCFTSGFIIAKAGFFHALTRLHGMSGLKNRLFIAGIVVSQMLLLSVM